MCCLFVVAIVDVDVRDGVDGDDINGDDDDGDDDLEEFCLGRVRGWAFGGNCGLARATSTGTGLLGLK